MQLTDGQETISNVLDSVFGTNLYKLLAVSKQN